MEIKMKNINNVIRSTVLISVLLMSFKLWTSSNIWQTIIYTISDITLMIAILQVVLYFISDRKSDLQFIRIDDKVSSTLIKTEENNKYLKSLIALSEAYLKPKLSQEQHKEDIYGEMIKRGQVYLADLSPVYGLEFNGVKPVVILSNDISNKHSPMITVAPILEGVNSQKIPTHVCVELNKDTFKKEAVVLTELIRTIDKGRLLKPLTNLDHKNMNEINRALLIHLKLT